MINLDPKSLRRQMTEQELIKWLCGELDRDSGLRREISLVARLTAKGLKYHTKEKRDVFNPAFKIPDNPKRWSQIEIGKLLMHEMQEGNEVLQVFGDVIRKEVKSVRAAINQTGAREEHSPGKTEMDKSGSD